MKTATQKETAERLYAIVNNIPLSVAEIRYLFDSLLPSDQESWLKLAEYGMKRYADAHHSGIVEGMRKAAALVNETTTLNLYPHLRTVINELILSAADKLEKEPHAQA